MVPQQKRSRLRRRAMATMVAEQEEEEGCHDLLSLQSRMTSDPARYENELLLQLRRFEACLGVFRPHSSSKSPSSSSATDQRAAAKELADMAMFLANVSSFYPQHLREFPQQLLGLLQSSEDSLRPALRRRLTQALNLLQSRQPAPKKTPRTIENTREEDETIAQPDDEELHAEDAADEFSAHFNHEITPQLLITSSRWCSTITIRFIAELLKILPNAHYYKRGSYELKQIVKYANNRNFTAIIAIHDNRKEPNGMLVIALPNGPTAHFKLSSLTLSKQIKGHGKPTSHIPELILNNFTTRIGHRVGRMLGSLFPQLPNFRGRRVVTFHNQRDFIFFRHHRYVFEAKDSSKHVKEGGTKGSDKRQEKHCKEPVKARLQECGPRFTLKLLSLQHGTFDSKFGEYEWVHKADMDTSRRRFFM